MSYRCIFGIAGKWRWVGTQRRLVLVALVAWPCSAIQAADSEPPALKDNRLFLSNEERLRYAQPVASQPTTAAVPEVVQLQNNPVRRSTSVRLDGYVRQPDGRVDVWVNGRLVDGRSGIDVARITRSGHVILVVEDQKVILRPGQRKSVLARTEHGSGL